ncbi:MAG TPA: type II toxin-antitoxin system VapB family antitoxin [Bacteroidia bacterium]|nr:type II toxin-antitoxin system VapB family antitoxin [Bacteroidia bacterium]
MATNLQIDHSLLEQAKSLSGLSTKKETVNEALKEFIQSRLKQQLLSLRGQIDYHEDHDYKALRRLKRP